MKGKIDYSKSGVNYNVMDPFKKLAQKAGQETAKNFPEVERSRGESAYVWEEENCFRAFVIEGLGTKNLVADSMQKITGKTYYDAIAQDSVAAIVNDIITVGTEPQVINAYFGTGDSAWLSDTDRSEALVKGWAKACQMAGAVWGGGETPSLSGIINPQTLDLVGACIGIIKPKERLILGDKLQDGDAILLIESNGIHANGLSLARAVAEKLPEGYDTKLPGGQIYGEALLVPTYIYVNLTKNLFEENIDIHYMVNITGHGWRKLMRAKKSFTYQINQIPPIPEIFDFIKKHSGSLDEDMYGIFNMGAGFAIYIPVEQVGKAQEIVEKHNLKSWNAGVVKSGPKQVVVKPKNIIFPAKSLDLC